MEQFERIRRDRRDEGLSIRAPYEATVRRWLTEDLDAPRKQRHTARRVWQRLIEEEGADVAESSVRNLVAQLRIEIGAGRAQAMVPQTHGPAEVVISAGTWSMSSLHGSSQPAPPWGAIVHRHPIVDPADAVSRCVVMMV